MPRKVRFEVDRAGEKVHSGSCARDAAACSRARACFSSFFASHAAKRSVKCAEPLVTEPASEPLISGRRRAEPDAPCPCGAALRDVPDAPRSSPYSLSKSSEPLRRPAW